VRDLDVHLPTAFPPLPPSPTGQGWPSKYIEAHKIVSNIFDHAIQVLNQDKSDTSCIAFHMNAITSDALPLVEAFETEGASMSDCLPVEWIHTCARILGWTVLALQLCTEGA